MAAVLRTTSDSLIFKSLIKFCLHNDNDNDATDIESNYNDISNALCCSSRIYGYLFVSWKSYLYCFEWKKLESCISNPGEIDMSASDALVKLQIYGNKHINSIKLSTSERYLAIKSENEILIVSVQDIILTKKSKILHQIHLGCEEGEPYSFDWNRFDVDKTSTESFSKACALDQLAVITNKKIIFFEPYKKITNELVRLTSHTPEYSQLLAACWHPTDSTLLAVADGNQISLYKNGKVVCSSQSPLMRSTSSSGKNHIHYELFIYLKINK